VQGFLFSKPVPADEVPALIARLAAPPVKRIAAGG
jgi:EAL domain-containing protein (putative c-di-GMP-specific phosphodiesterase class I)